MIDHITIRVNNFDKAKKFYDTVLATLGMKIVLGSKKERFWGYGVTNDPVFEISQSTKNSPAHTGVHVAFRAKSKKMVQEFYAVAINAGGKDNGAPGPRPEYTNTYYAAFVLDVDGNNIEACVY